MKSEQIKHSLSVGTKSIQSRVYDRETDEVISFVKIPIEAEVGYLQEKIQQQQAEIEALKNGIEKLKDAYCQKDHEVKKAEQYCLDAFERGRQIGYADGMISRKAQEK